MQVLFGTMFFAGITVLIAGIIFLLIRFITKKAKKVPLTIVIISLISIVGGLIGGVAASDPEAQQAWAAKRAEPKTNDARSEALSTPAKEVVVRASEPPVDETNSEGLKSQPVKEDIKDLGYPIEEQTTQLHDLQETLEKYMFDYFGGGMGDDYKAAWYKSIKGFKIYQAEDYYTVSIDTTLFLKKENKDAAVKLTGPFLGWANSEQIPLRTVEVNSEDGWPITSVDNPMFGK